MKLRTLSVSLFLAVSVFFAGCSGSGNIINEPEVREDSITGFASETNADTEKNSSSDDSDRRASVPAFIKSLELDYATEFTVTQYEDGYYEVHK